MNSINMMSKADMVKGHGVLSAHDEQVALVKETLSDIFEVRENDKRKADITHYHSINPEFFMGIRSMKKKGITVGYVHFLPETVENSIKLPRLFKKIFYKYMLAFYKRMDYLVTVNPYFIDVLQKYGVKKEKIYYIPNYVSDKAFHPLPNERKAGILKDYGLDPNQFTVLCVGQLQKRKGVLEFVEVAKTMPDVQFAWAGDFSFGKISDGYEEIKYMMEDIPSNVKFLGMVDREKMNEVYNMADVMFLPSFEELFPMTILESMNCAIPILVRDLDIYKPILFDYCLTGNSNEEFVDILKKLMISKDYYCNAAQKSYEGHEMYSREHVSDMWRTYYSHLLYTNSKEPEQETVPVHNIIKMKHI